MKASVERRENAKHEPDVYGFEGEAFDEFLRCMKMAQGRKDRTVLIRLGLGPDGKPEAWWHVKADGEDVGAGNASFNCPPRPPEDCAL